MPAAKSDAATSPSDPAKPDGKTTCFGTKPLDAYVADDKLCAFIFAEGVNGARQLAFAPNGDLFVNNDGKVTVLWDADGDGYSSASERSVFGEAPGLNHGIAFSRDNKFVYVSSGTTVYRYKYSSGQRAAEGGRETVIDGIPTGGHSARPLAFDSKNRLYVSIGSGSNVDTAANDIKLRSQLRRFELPDTLPKALVYADSGEIIATGMRNESGLFVDAQDRLWGVENGRDNLNDGDLGGDIHNDNPGEEINLIDGQGAKFYGYPSCFSEHTVRGGKGQGTQWADESLDGNLRKTDEFCSDPSQVHPPAFVMPAHWAPLGIIVYGGRSLPYTGDLIIGAHGSWNRSPATGRVVARLKLQGTTVSDLQIILGQKNSSGELAQGGWNVRPVDVREGPDGAIYVSDDSGGRVIKLGYKQAK
jgi:glucose/arabinose dehydrogenase